MAVTEPARQAGLSEDWRKRILADPGLILDDPEIMRALVLTSERAMGGNIVDMRGMAMERLESRLERLEETHRAVIAAAYDNLSSTNQIHRALLNLMDAQDFEAFVLGLGVDVAAILRIDSLKLVLESPDGSGGGGLGKLDDVLVVRKAGFVDSYMSGTRGMPARPITLRQGHPPQGHPYGPQGDDLHSEALVLLDLGEKRLPGMLAMGSEDPHRFKPGQGTDLVAFFSGAFERMLRQWLS